MKKIILIFFAWALLILIINKFSVKFIPDRTSYELPEGINIEARFTLLPLLNFDGRNYLEIVRSGYTFRDGHNLQVFFPAYPFLIRIISSGGVINPVYLGLSISLISGLLSLIIFDKMFGLKAAILLFAFPTSFFFTAYYTESIFLLFVLLFFFFLNKKKFAWASAFAALASGTRIFGLALTPVIIYEILKGGKSTRKHLWTAFIAPLGFIIYSLLSKNSIIFSQSDWNRNVGLLGPYYAIADSLRHVFQGPQATYDSPFTYPVIILELIIFIFTTLVVIKMYKKIDAKYFIYSAASLLIILLGGSLASSPRYILTIFPIFIYLAKYLKRYYYFYLTISLLLLVFFSTLFLRGYWVA